MKKLIKYPFQKLYKFFLWASGAELEILKQAPTDANKYFGIGGTIIFTALMAAFAGGYAFFTAFRVEILNDLGLVTGYTVLSEVLSIFFGVFWGALIFNLDRYIVSTFGVGNGKKTISKQELIEAAPRLLMAILLGFVIATPLELKLFESEINAQIASKNALTIREQAKDANDASDDLNHYYTEEIKTLREKIDGREKELDRKLEKRRDAYNKYMCELNGTCGTGKFGEGPVFREAKENYNKLDKEYSLLETKYRKLDKDDNETIQEYSKIIIENKNKARIKAANLENEISGRNGLLARLEAMSDLMYQEVSDYEIIDGKEVLLSKSIEKSSIWYAKWLITLLFIFIEIAPIMFKMMTERGTYDDILDRIKHEAKVKQLLLQSNINEEINTAVKVHADKNAQKLNAELTANKDLLKSIASAQAEIAQVAIEEWKKEQLEKVKKNPSSMIKS